MKDSRFYENYQEVKAHELAAGRFCLFGCIIDKKHLGRGKGLSRR